MSVEDTVDFLGRIRDHRIVWDYTFEEYPKNYEFKKTILEKLKRRKVGGLVLLVVSTLFLTTRLVLVDDSLGTIGHYAHCSQGHLTDKTQTNQ